MRGPSLCRHAVAITPVATREGLKSFPLSTSRLRPSPSLCWVGCHIECFEACSAFTHVTACLLAESLKRPFPIEGFGGIVTSTAAPIATGWNDQLPGGNCTH